MQVLYNNGSHTADFEHYYRMSGVDSGLYRSVEHAAARMSQAGTSSTSRAPVPRSRTISFMT